MGQGFAPELTRIASNVILARMQLRKDPITRSWVITGDDPETSLWRPFGSRRVENILVTDSAEDMRQRQIRYVVVGGFHLAQMDLKLEEWLERAGGEVVAKTTATVKVAEGEQPWYVVRLRQ